MKTILLGICVLFSIITVGCDFHRTLSQSEKDVKSILKKCQDKNNAQIIEENSHTKIICDNVVLEYSTQISTSFIDGVDYRLSSLINCSLKLNDNTFYPLEERFQKECNFIHSDIEIIKNQILENKRNNFMKKVQ